MIRSLSLLACCLATGSAAQDNREFGMSGDWEIRVDNTNGNGCYMQKVFETGTRIAIGYVPDRDGAFFAAYNSKWTDIEPDETGALMFDFGESRFKGEVVGRINDGQPGGFAFFDNPEFANEFARRNSVKLIGDGGYEEAFALTGSSKAIKEVKSCQKAQSN